MKFTLYWLVLLVIPFSSKAEILPADNSILNFTQVMFQFDEQGDADSYILTIIKNAERNEQVSYTKTSLACLVTEGLMFGRTYQWNYTAYKADKLIYSSPAYSFTIAPSILVDSSQFRYRVLQQETGQFQDNLLLLDNPGIMVNRKGEPVWYMPNDSAGIQITPFRNLTFTKDGHFTYLKDEACFEKDIYGHLTWEGPNTGKISGDSIEHYHHDFMKLADSTYMVCGFRFEETPNYYDPAVMTKIRYNTLIQYTKNGKIVWSWNEKDHFSKAEMFAKATSADVGVGGTHMNSFDYNKKTNTLILSCRDNNSLTLIDKHTGRVLNSLKGDAEDRPLKSDSSSPIHFYRQHSAVFLKDGTVLFYNNNVKSEKAERGGKLQMAIYPTLINISFPADRKMPKKYGNMNAGLTKNILMGYKAGVAMLRH